MALGLGFSAAIGLANAADLTAPGFTPESRGEHALTGILAHVRPGVTLTNATLLIRDGRIASVGVGLNIPASARTWNLPGAHVYAGFIDPYLTLGSTAGAVTQKAELRDVTAAGSVSAVISAVDRSNTGTARLNRSTDGASRSLAERSTAADTSSLMSS
jgi:dihydroorotase-like cyclic amidohydrolase